MIETIHHFETETTTEHYECRIVLSCGTVAGTGYGPTDVSARYWAALDAVDAGHHDAACGAARMLCHTRERAVRRACGLKNEGIPR